MQPGLLAVVGLLAAQVECAERLPVEVAQPGQLGQIPRSRRRSGQTRDPRSRSRAGARGRCVGRLRVAGSSTSGSSCPLRSVSGCSCTMRATPVPTTPTSPAMTGESGGPTPAPGLRRGRPQPTDRRPAPEGGQHRVDAEPDQAGDRPPGGRRHRRTSPGAPASGCAPRGSPSASVDGVDRRSSTVARCTGRRCAPARTASRSGSPPRPSGPGPAGRCRGGPGAGPAEEPDPAEPGGADGAPGPDGAGLLDDGRRRRGRREACPAGRRACRAGGTGRERRRAGLAALAPASPASKPRPISPASQPSASSGRAAGSKSAARRSRTSSTSFQPGVEQPDEALGEVAGAGVLGVHRRAGRPARCGGAGPAGSGAPPAPRRPSPVRRTRR